MPRTRALWMAVLLLSSQGAVRAEGHRTVAVLEYRAGARGAAGIGDQLAQLLKNNAAFQVIDPAEARRRGGAKIDADVARCSGEAACIAQIGARVGADEVLLVGVSQLGDIILSLKRVDVAKGTALASAPESLAPDAEASDADVLGWLRQLYPPEAFRRYGAIRVVADIPGARVELNGQAAGLTPMNDPIKVRAPGTYRLRVGKRDFVPFQARIDVLPDATVEVRASLVREALTIPWYKRWYVWAAVGGVVAVTGLSLAIYYGTRVDETPQGFILRMP